MLSLLPAPVFGRFRQDSATIWKRTERFVYLFLITSIGLKVGCEVGPKAGLTSCHPSLSPRRRFRLEIDGLSKMDTIWADLLLKPRAQGSYHEGE
jgi:hypothetical protein